MIEKIECTYLRYPDGEPFCFYKNLEFAVCDFGGTLLWLGRNGQIKKNQTVEIHEVCKQYGLAFAKGAFYTHYVNRARLVTGCLELVSRTYD